MNRIFLLIMAAGVLGVSPVSAADSTNAVKQFMQKVQQAYRSASYLSFHVVYRYANKDKPKQYLDTMSGDVAIDKNHMRFTIEHMETVTNDTYTIQIDNDEKLIYVSTPQSVQMNDPVAMLDSALAHFEGIRVGVAHNKGMATLTLRFPPGQTYKNIMMVVNETTGYFEKVVYELYTSELVEKDQLMGQGGNGPYQNEGNIEILFSDYRQGRFTDELFSESRYINRLAKGQYQAAEKYKDYQVFLASSKL
ncbi:MAG TPA: hypothetical protein VIM79_26115 [Niastella sp.]